MCLQGIRIHLCRWISFFLNYICNFYYHDCCFLEFYFAKGTFPTALNKCRRKIHTRKRIVEFHFRKRIEFSPQSVSRFTSFRQKKLRRFFFSSSLYLEFQDVSKWRTIPKFVSISSQPGIGGCHIGRPYPLPTRTRVQGNSNLVLHPNVCDKFKVLFTEMYKSDRIIICGPIQLINTKIIQISTWKTI